MALAKVTDEWVPLQIKVFTRWVNGQLKLGNDSEIEDITKDLASGVHLVHLARVLTQKDPQLAWKQDPKLDVYKVQNCDLALDMFKNDGVQLVGISGKDVNDNNVKLILGLVWTLILHYSIGKSINGDIDEQKPGDSNKKSSKSVLLEWAVEKTSGYPNVNNNFQPYDLSMCALLDSYVPEKINYNSLNQEDTEHNAQLATDVMNDLGIPVYIYPDDVIKSGNQVDEKTLLTQLASAKVVLDNLHKQEIQEREVKLEGEKLGNENEEDKLQISSLKNELAEVRSELDRLMKENNVSKDAIKCLKYEVKMLKKASSEGVESKGQASSTNESVIHEQMRNEIQSLQSEMQTLKSQFQENETSHNDKYEHFTSAKDEVEKLNKEREEDKAEIERLKNDLSEVRSQLEKFQNERDSCKESIEAFRTELEKIKESSSQLPDVKERSVTLNESDEHEQLRKDIQSLQSELQKMNSQVQANGTKNYLFIFVILIALLVCVKLLK